MQNVDGNNQPDPYGWIVFDDTAEIDERDWNSLLDMINFYQIFPGFHWNARTAVHSLDWAGTDERPVPERVDEWQPLSTEVLACWRPLFDHLRASGAPLPVIGYEFVSPDQTVLFMAEIAWPELRVAIVDEAQGVVEIADWTLYTWSPDKTFPAIDFGGHNEYRDQ